MESENWKDNLGRCLAGRWFIVDIYSKNMMLLTTIVSSPKLDGKKSIYIESENWKNCQGYSLRNVIIVYLWFTFCE